MKFDRKPPNTDRHFLERADDQDHVCDGQRLERGNELIRERRHHGYQRVMVLWNQVQARGMALAFSYWPRLRPDRSA